MRSLTRRLAELDEALNAGQQMLVFNPKSFAAELSLQSLTQFQERLERERIQLVSHRKRERLAIALKGQSFADNTANIGELGVFLVRLQKLYSSIAQAITTGPRLRGPISRDIENATAMRFADVFPSSFGMEIYIKPNFDMFGERLVISSLTTLFNLLSATRAEGEISRLSAELGQRAFSHLRRVLNDLARSHSGFELEWTDVSGTKFVWGATDEDVPRLWKNVSRFRTSSSTERKTAGILLGASLLRDRFEIMTTTQQVIEGKIARTAKLKICEFCGRVCLATVEQVDIIEVVTGETRTYYTLTDIEASTAATAPQ